MRASLRATVRRLAAHALLLLAAGLLWVPVGWLAWLSLRADGGWTLDHWRRVAGADVWGVAVPWLRWAGTSALLAGVVAAAMTAAAAPLGYVLARGDFPGSRVLDRVMLALALLPPVVVLPGLRVLLEDVAPAVWWLGPTTRTALVLCYLAGLALPVLLFREVQRAIPRRIEEAARVDGATRWDAFRRVALPAGRPYVLAGFTAIFLAHLVEYPVAAEVLGGTRHATLAHGLEQLARPGAAAGPGAFAAVALAVALPAGGVFLLARRILPGGWKGGR